MSRIFITGGAGCLGSNLFEKYILEGHEICLIDNFITGKKEVVPKLDNLKLIEGSISDFDLLKSSIENFKPEYIIHSAASYKDPKNFAEDVRTNIKGTINLIEISLLNNIKKIINFQTSLCYGKPKELPIPINHSVDPFTSYGITKTAGENFLFLSELPVISLRLANICGPRLAIGPIPTFYKRLKNNQKCFCSDTVRDFLDIKDFFDLMDIVLFQDVPIGKYNISSGNGHSIKEIFKIVCEYLNLKNMDVPIMPVGEDDVKEVVLDPSETEKKLGWKSKISFNDTIKNQLSWYDNYGISEIFSHLKSK
ncbi:MAG: nucleotide sugar epimerase [Candidatus Marinimicrobia bacterium]|nr:nucleotide sugar epimerase [Candidatus Neomarinimicrobiota bacterium]RPG13261.1 MAG: NAD-dependent epimerase/dehydratase family protein [Pelagibacteraceae bacterium TMED232]|tara:strand:- start:2180 stop:3106 length:927 start_codon:yes stop_codon:yes gene_type:complete